MTISLTLFYHFYLYHHFFSAFCCNYMGLLHSKLLRLLIKTVHSAEQNFILFIIATFLTEVLTPLLKPRFNIDQMTRLTQPKNAQCLKVPLITLLSQFLGCTTYLWLHFFMEDVLKQFF